MVVSPAESSKETSPNRLTRSASRQSRIFDFIVAHKRAHDGIPPTIRQICQACGISSSSMVQLYLRKLQDEGKIRLGEGSSARSIIVVGGRWELRA